MPVEIIDGCGCCAGCDDVASWRIEAEYAWGDSGTQKPWVSTILHLTAANGDINTVDLGALGYPIMPDPIDESYYQTPYTATIASDIVVQVPKSGWTGNGSGGHLELCDELTIPAGDYVFTYLAAVKAYNQSFWTDPVTP